MSGAGGECFKCLAFGVPPSESSFSLHQKEGKKERVKKKILSF